MIALVLGALAQTYHSKNRETMENSVLPATSKQTNLFPFKLGLFRKTAHSADWLRSVIRQKSGSADIPCRKISNIFTSVPSRWLRSVIALNWLRTVVVTGVASFCKSCQPPQLGIGP